MKMPRNLNLLLEAFCIGLAIICGVFVVVNRVFEVMDVSQAANVVTFTILIALASWIWTRPISQ